MEIIYHIPDFYFNYNLNIFLIKELKNNPQIFYPNIKIGSVYGSFPSAIWNGGRTVHGFLDKNKIENIIKEFNNLGVPLRFTWTNSLIEEKHTYDSYCNLIMQLANNGFNEVLVNNEVLENYIKNNYSNYKLISSTTKSIKKIDSINNELDKDYSLVVLDYNFNNDFDKLNLIKFHEKCELLVDAICCENCPNRLDHYKSLSEYQLNFDMISDKYADCVYQYDYENIKNRKHYISYNDIIEKYIPLGFKNFKIEGRTNPEYVILERYQNYFIKSEHRDTFLFNYLKSKISFNSN